MVTCYTNAKEGLLGRELELHHRHLGCNDSTKAREGQGGSGDFYPPLSLHTKLESIESMRPLLMSSMLCPTLFVSYARMKDF